MSTGYITINVFTADKAMPLPQVQVRITDLRIALDQTIFTDANGRADRIKVYAPEKEASLSPQQTTIPYEKYNIEINKDGYIPTVITNVPVFPGENSIQPVALIPLPEGQQFQSMVNQFEIPPNGLLLRPSESQIQTQPPYSPPAAKQVSIPEFIRVHLGAPGSDDKTVRVLFSDYVKNVASSEIYATWPKEALRANVFAIISFALNRLYTNYYPAQGYDFDITALPDQDPYFVDGRNIFFNINEIVDAVFNEFIRRIGFNEPLLAKYCNGITEVCEGLSQWGSVTQALQGMHAEAILKYYYGNVQMAETDAIGGVSRNYPGKPLRLGSVGNDVRHIEGQLNYIGKTYRNIPEIPQENGNFDAYDQDAVIAFQRQFNLVADGIVGKRTWYQLAFAYNAVRRLAELSVQRSNMDVPATPPDQTLDKGSSGQNVRLAQFLLNAASVFYNEIIPVDISGTYDDSTASSVRSFQKAFSLPQTGKVDAATWSALYAVYNGIIREIGPVMDALAQQPLPPVIPGTRPQAAPPSGTGAPGQKEGTGPVRMGMTGMGQTNAGPGETGAGSAGMGATGGAGGSMQPGGNAPNREQIQAAMNYAMGGYPYMPDRDRGMDENGFLRAAMAYQPTQPGPGQGGMTGGTQQGIGSPYKNISPEDMNRPSFFEGLQQSTPFEVVIPAFEPAGMESGAGRQDEGMAGGMSRGMGMQQDEMTGETGETSGITAMEMDHEDMMRGMGMQRGRMTGETSGMTGMDMDHEEMMKGMGMQRGRMTGETSGMTEMEMDREEMMRGMGMQRGRMTEETGESGGMFNMGMTNEDMMNRMGMQRDQMTDETGGGVPGMSGMQPGGMRYGMGMRQNGMSDETGGMSTGGIRFGGLLDETDETAGGTGMETGRMSSMQPGGMQSDGLQQGMTGGMQQGMTGGMTGGMQQGMTGGRFGMGRQDRGMSGGMTGSMQQGMTGGRFGMGRQDRGMTGGMTGMQPGGMQQGMTGGGMSGMQPGGMQQGMTGGGMAGMQPGGMQQGMTGGGMAGMQPGGMQRGMTGGGMAGMQPGGMQRGMTGGTGGQQSGLVQPYFQMLRGTDFESDESEEIDQCPAMPTADPVYSERVLKIGSKGRDVQLMQEFLSFIALSLMRYKKITNELKVLVNDGIYGIETTDAVIRFQNRYEMPVNGVIDEATWRKIVEVYNFPCA